MRKSTQVAHCCATYTIEGFPSNMDVDDRYFRSFGTPESFQKEVNRHIEKAYYQNKSLIVCTVNTAQTRAEEWLKEMGFVSSGRMERRTFPLNPHQTKVSLLFKPVCDENHNPNLGHVQN